RSLTVASKSIRIRNGLVLTGGSCLLLRWGYLKGIARPLRRPTLYSSGCLAKLMSAMFHKSAGVIEDARLKKETRSLSAAVWESPRTLACNGWLSHWWNGSDLMEQGIATDGVTHAIQPSTRARRRSAHDDSTMT